MSRRSGGEVVRPRRDDGAALVEFALLGVVLLVPVVYLVFVVAAVQRAAFAASAAVRDSARAYVTATTTEQAQARARLAALVALQDAHVAVAPDQPWVRCGPQPCDLSPGTAVTVSVRVDVPLPGVAALLCGPGGCRASIPVTASHTERVDCFAETPTARTPTC